MQNVKFIECVAERAIDLLLDSARARGRIGGRPRKEDSTRQAMAAAILNDPKNNVQDVCRALKVSRATAFRLAKAGRAAQVQQPSAATSTSQAHAQKAERGSAAAASRAAGSGGGQKAAASSPKHPHAATSKAKTLTTSTKGQRPASTSKRK